MKKFLSLLMICLLTASLSACFFGNSDSKQPIPNDNGITNSKNTVEEDEITTENTNEAENEIVDTRDEPEVIRQEISNMLRDAEFLINNQLFDDAKSVLKNLRSRELTPSEKKKVDELSTRLIKISD